MLPSDKEERELSDRGEAGILEIGENRGAITPSNSLGVATGRGWRAGCISGKKPTRSTVRAAKYGSLIMGNTGVKLFGGSEIKFALQRAIN